MSEAPNSSLWVLGKRPLMSRSLAIRDTKFIILRSGRGKERFLVCQFFIVSIPGTYLLDQFRNH